MRDFCFSGGAPAGGVTFPLRGKSPKAHQRGPFPRRSPLETLPDGQGRNPAGFPPLDPPAYVNWSRYFVQNSRLPSPVQAPGEACASPGRGGAIEHLQVFPAPSQTGKTKPARFATTRRSPAALFPRFLSRERNQAAGGLVGMDLTGFVTAVSVRAAITRECSAIPPLQTEA